ncbi:PTS galactitol transporter subunit IIC [Sphingomonas sp. Leaf407]|uniref:phosphoenolpyruvate--protein phosphotransferase n=1 Tax=unclassified Sphingomonas TaxID=196159 RepID=UPI0006F95127|nr:MULTISPECIES: phosphoenolpyruvate--protein phosphotransferase [unclassified Sphingomonas]KQN36538.1 PTS galactitol transporter subunit IIC [Sphingomonas sp. Leaf42]KQT27159.1 PTS galactitol transporter subunit IIC [Sphingomonas sp. Leaf407]
MTAIRLTAPLKGWACSLDEVPDAVFAGRMLGDGIAIDPVGTSLHAPCDGEVLTLHSGGHAITLRGTGGVELLMHIGIDTVQLGGAPFTARVAPGERVTQGQVLIEFDLDAIVCAAPSVVTPILVTNGDAFRIVAHGGGRMVEPGDVVLTLEPVAAREAVAETGGERVSAEVRVPMAHGIHARPAARIGDVAKGFSATSWLAKDGAQATTRGAVGLLGLGIRHGDVIEVRASGADAAQAVAALVALIEGGMGEATALDAPPPAPIAPAPARLRDLPAGQLGGTLAAAGYAIGTARWLRVAEIEVPVDGQGIEVEAQRLERALGAVRARLAAAPGTGAGAAIRAAHIAFLDDDDLRAEADRGIVGGQDAGHAWRGATRAQAMVLKGLGDSRLAERADDLLDLERQVLAELTGAETAALAFAPGTILLADDLLPSQVMALDPATVVALAIERGGPTSHVAILAGTMGLPALVAIGAALQDVADGTTLILDADGGVVHVDPPEAVLMEARAIAGRRADAAAAALAAAGETCRTADGVRIEAFANLGSVEDARIAVANGAEGSGLLRTEFLFLERDTAPDATEQAALYGEIAGVLEGRPLIVRLLDVGGDKPAPYLPIAPEENPALGLRGIRVALAMPEILEAQLRGILSVRPVGQCRIMIPMVASVAEIVAVRAVVDRLRGEMGIAERVEVGIMVETPAAAVTAGTLAGHADFLSIGTNDLTQYALAMDRGNPSVAAGIDGLHPAVLQLIAHTAQGAARHGRWVGVCGGLASDGLAVPLLIGLGITELSAAPRFVPELKALVRTLSIDRCHALATRALAAASAGEVRAMVRDFLKEQAA